MNISCCPNATVQLQQNEAGPAKRALNSSAVRCNSLLESMRSEVKMSRNGLECGRQLPAVFRKTIHKLRTGMWRIKMSSSASVVAAVVAARPIIYLGMDVHKESITIAVLPADAKAPTRLFAGLISRANGLHSFPAASSTHRSEGRREFLQPTPAIPA